MEASTPRRKGAVAGILTGLGFMLWMSHQPKDSGLWGRFKGNFWDGVAYGVGGVFGIILGIESMGRLTSLLEERRVRFRIERERSIRTIKPSRAGTSLPAPSTDDPSQFHEPGEST